MPEETKTCFIIMPLTTPEPFVAEYRDGARHFRHVLDCLFIPSVKKAGYTPKPPIAKGSDLIHAEIVRSLETCDVVLCDMSCLNPNVFFEFGIRTSLNKPVCVVKDELTKNVPFDTGILNYHEYRSTLEPWELEEEIKKLAEHLCTSAERSKGENTLWRHFGLRSEARPYEGDTGTDAKLDYLALQIDSLRQKVDDVGQESGPRRAPTRMTKYGLDKMMGLDIGRMFKAVAKRFQPPVLLAGFSFSPSGRVVAEHSGHLGSMRAERIRYFVRKEFGLELSFRRIDVAET